MIHPTLAKINDYTSQPVSLMHAGLLAFFFIPHFLFFSFLFFWGGGCLGYCISVCVLLGFLVFLLFCLFFLRGVGLFDVHFSNNTDIHVFNQILPKVKDHNMNNFFLDFKRFIRLQLVLSLSQISPIGFENTQCTTNINY